MFHHRRKFKYQCEFSPVLETMHRAQCHPGWRSIIVTILWIESTDYLILIYKYMYKSHNQQSGQQGSQSGNQDDQDMSQQQGKSDRSGSSQGSGNRDDQSGTSGGKQHDDHKSGNSGSQDEFHR